MKQLPDTSFCCVLRRHVNENRFAVTPGLLAKLSGIPKATIVNWLEGRVLRPRRWQDVIAVADALRLDETRVGELLAASRHAGLQTLILSATENEKHLFVLWPQTQLDLLGEQILHNASGAELCPRPTSDQQQCSYRSGASQPQTIRTRTYPQQSPCS
jgi:hypothetical protein